MRQTTFQDFAEHRLSAFIQPEDRYSQMEEMLTNQERSTLRAPGVAYKASRDFLQIIQSYLTLLEKESVCFDPIPYGEQDWKTEEQLAELYYGRFGHHPHHVRLERMEELFLEELPELEARQAKKLYHTMRRHPRYLGTDEELKSLSRSHVRKKVTAISAFIKEHRFVNPIRTYRRLFEEPELMKQAAAGTTMPSDSVWASISQYTLAYMNQGIVPCEDVPPLLYLLESLTGWNSFNSIRHVILDEAQDYSPFQYEIIRRLFPRSKLTLLGDLNQAISPHMRIDSYDYVEELYGREQTHIMRLAKSYRSTTEIVEFTKALLPGGEAIEAFSRSGELPSLLEALPEQHTERVVGLLTALQQSGAASIAVICKTAAEAQEAHEALLQAGAPGSLHLITKEETRFVNTLVVVPVYLAKGLEFDSVVVWDGGEAVYSHEEERKLFYTACTRAMNQLQVVYTGKPNPYMADVNPSLYEKHCIADHAAARKE